jgi:hypothetical protein
MAYTMEGKLDEIIDTLNEDLVGDAVAANVLYGKTCYNTSVRAEDKVTGTMPNNAGDVACVSAHMATTTTLHVVPANGYVDGVDDATIVNLATVDTDLVAGNIKVGVALLGVTGTFTSDANAVAADIALGKTAYVNGIKITGTAGG